MKKNLLLLFLVIGFGAIVDAQKKPYNNLIFSEVRMDNYDLGYCEITNKGTETIDLSEFEMGHIGPWDTPWGWYADANFRFPKKMLAPGESYVISTTQGEEMEKWKTDPLHNRERTANPEMTKLSNYVFDMQESGGAGDSITPSWYMMRIGDGLFTWYLKHIYTIGEIQDSMIIDQVCGVFDEEDGTNYEIPYDVAGVRGATNNDILIRKASVTTGITEFSSHAANDEAAKQQFNNNRGLDLADSEWIPVPLPGNSHDAGYWREIYWTVGNSGDYKLNANTLVPKTTSKIKIDLAQATITVPWGVRYDDSIMVQMVRKPGLAWQYEYAPTTEDSAYTSARNGDKLTLYVCGNEATIKKFSIIVLDPAPSANVVMSKTYFDYKLMVSHRDLAEFKITDGVSGIDTISNIDYAIRVDTLYKYLEKAPKASWKIIFKSGINKPDLNFGDKLQVTAENGSVKEYFLKINKFLPSEDPQLASITWPDMPLSFKGDIAALYGWKGDTIPGFTPGNTSYILNIPLEYQGIPALMFTKKDLNSKVLVKRAKTLDGTPEDATVTFTVTAEDGTTKYVYTVRFVKEKDPSTVQQWKAEPFISQIMILDRWFFPWLEIANPGTDPLDLSHYMIATGWGNAADIFSLYNGIEDYPTAYMKYVPGKKWQDEVNWRVQPRILERDLGTNEIVAAGEVFVMSAIDITLDPDYGPGNDITFHESDIDFNFMKTPWGANYGYKENAIQGRTNRTFCLFKILNDSVINGLKPATDINDFELIDVFGKGDNSNYIVGGFTIATMTGLIRKPNIYKGNTEYGGSFGTNQDDTEWIRLDRSINEARGYTEWPDFYRHDLDGIGSQVIDPVTFYRSTVTSFVYKVSPGYTQTETIRGLAAGTSVSDFYNNIIKAHPLQALKVKSAATGNELAEASAISNGDKLIVLSADSTNTSTYILDVSALSSNAMLTSSNYSINVTGTTGTIAGFNRGTLLKNVVAGIVVPVGATLNITDKNDAYMSLIKLNYDTVYVNVIATDDIYFEVVAENGTTKIMYQLIPTSNPRDVYVTSDVYSVDQFLSLINFVPYGTTVTSLMSNVTPAQGATIVVYDKAGFVRETGEVYRDDKLVVTSADGTVTKVYYLAMLNFYVNKYLAFVVSDDYQINQIQYEIKGMFSNTSATEFISKLYPSFGATLTLLDKNGTVSTASKVNAGDKLRVTAQDGATIVVYTITDVTGTVVSPVAETIKMYPNPTKDRVIINGLAKGNRVQVFNAAGITLRDVIVDNSTEYVSISAQPAGIYIFVVSSGNQYIKIQKIVKE